MLLSVAEKLKRLEEPNERRGDILILRSSQGDRLLIQRSEVQSGRRGYGLLAADLHQVSQDLADLLRLSDHGYRILTPSIPGDPLFAFTARNP